MNPIRLFLIGAVILCVAGLLSPLSKYLAWPLMFVGAGFQIRAFYLARLDMKEALNQNDKTRKKFQDITSLLVEIERAKEASEKPKNA